MIGYTKIYKKYPCKGVLYGLFARLARWDFIHTHVEQYRKLVIKHMKVTTHKNKDLDIEVELFLFTRDELEAFIQKVKKQVYNELASSKVKGNA